MAKGAKPFRYRGKWRATVTLANGKRPAQDFDRYDDAVQWIAEQLANANAQHAPELGGPTMATLADALRLYAQLYTVNKRGFASELIQPVQPFLAHFTANIGLHNDWDEGLDGAVDGRTNAA